MGFHKNKVVYHGTGRKSLENILKEGFIRQSQGVYGNGVYTVLSPHKAIRFASSNEEKAIIAINPRAYENKAFIPKKEEKNRLKDWIVINENVHERHILGALIVDSKNRVVYELTRERENKLLGRYNNELELKKIIGRWRSKIERGVYNPISYRKIKYKEVV